MRELVRDVGGILCRVALALAGLVVLAVVAVATSFLYAARPDLVWIALYLGASLVFVGWSVRRLRRP